MGDGRCAPFCQLMNILIQYTEETSEKGRREIWAIFEKLPYGIDYSTYIWLECFANLPLATIERRQNQKNSGCVRVK